MLEIIEKVTGTFKQGCQSPIDLILKLGLDLACSFLFLLSKIKCKTVNKFPERENEK